MIRKLPIFTLTALFAAAIMVAGPHARTASAAEVANGVHIVVAGEETNSQLPIYVKEGSLYAPLSFISAKFGAQLHWDNAQKQVEIVTPLGDKVVYTARKYQMQANGKTWITDVAPFVVDGRTYLPLRSMAEWLHADVTWNAAKKTADFEPVPLYTVQEHDTLESIAKQYCLAPEWIKEVNGLTSAELTAGASLKIVIPSVIRNKEANEDMYLLAKLIDAEAGNEPLEGQIAVGNVVMNRVHSERFPDTIRDVIYAQNQFTPALNGMLDSIEPKESAIIAAKKAIAGEAPAKDALYFFNPRTSSNDFLDSLDVVADIGSHRFAK
ncbi:MAG TPA: cell wall hydrolase [Bacilli bacterium]